MKKKLTETIDRKQDIKKWMLLFSQADRKGFFTFTSGHFGALGLDEDSIYHFFLAKGLNIKIKKLILVFFEFAIFLMLAILPIKNGIILLRTVLRYAFNSKVNALNPMTVISLGSQEANNDRYFGLLLRQLDGKFDYLKIVAGYGIRAKKFVYIETALSFFGLVHFSIEVVLLPFTSFFYLLKNINKIEGFNLKIMYFTLGLREIYTGKVAQNQLINKSVNCWINKNSNIVEKILFPMEGRSWEQRIVDIMTQNKLKSIGYIHCVVTPKHFGLVASGFYKPNEIPKVIVAPSQMVKQLAQKTFTSAEIRKGYFLRGEARRNLKNLQPSSLLLFALTGDAKECKRVMSFIIEAGINKNYRICVRLNPNASSYLNLVKFAKNTGINLYSYHKEDKPAVCFFRSSSVALDYLSINIPSVYLSLNETVTGNVFDLDSRFRCAVLKVTSNFSLNLVDILNQIENSPKIREGKKISIYYLDQSYNKINLKQLIS